MFSSVSSLIWNENKYENGRQNLPKDYSLFRWDGEPCFYKEKWIKIFILGVLFKPIFSENVPFS